LRWYLVFYFYREMKKKFLVFINTYFFLLVLPF